jgi:hypothetical protein
MMAKIGYVNDCSGNLKGRQLLENLSVDGRIHLSYTLNKYINVREGLNWLRIDSIGGL